MSPTTAAAIELFLFEKGDWISSEFLCSHFDVSERRLRLLGQGFLISRPQGGYIHRYHATPAEMESYCDTKWKHGLGELRNVKLLRKLYRNRVRPYPVDEAGQPALL